RRARDLLEQQVTGPSLSRVAAPGFEPGKAEPADLQSARRAGHDQVFSGQHTPVPQGCPRCRVSDYASGRGAPHARSVSFPQTPGATVRGSTASLGAECLYVPFGCSDLSYSLTQNTRRTKLPG